MLEALPCTIAANALASATQAAKEHPTDTLPLALNLRDRSCLVVGAGGVALRKIELLLAAGARVRVVAPAMHPDTEALCGERGVQVERRAVRDSDCDGHLLVVAATGIREVNELVSRACQARNILVNCVDDPGLSSALFPALVDRGAVTVAISTGGASPTLARRLRERIEAMLPAGLGSLADFLAQARPRVRNALGSVAERQRFWDRILDGPLPDLLTRGDTEGADALLSAELTRTESPLGTVSLVGAGPGDPDLLTLKALHCLQRADVVLYDNLVGPEILDRCRRDARKIHVGKRRAFPGTRQQAINAMLVQEASAGHRVVRLKGGDPFIFGRGGEEIEALTEAEIPFEVVPGITAALGCAAYAGIPLTHRDLAQSVRFVTGHRTGGEFNLDWPELAAPRQTLAIYMGVEALSALCTQLIAHGAPPETPAAVISRATLPEQRMHIGTIGELANASNPPPVPPPAITIIGKVVTLAFPRKTSTPVR